MKGEWVIANIEDEEIKYSYESHSTQKIKGMPWLYCKHCGLVFLRNKLTNWCAKMGCNYSYHKNYESQIKNGGCS